jgi:predicted  nucleic acid-binding Zn-ribbon protein
MEGHEERAAELEYELADMEKQQDDLDDSIHAAKDDWEAKKRDDSVPGAGINEAVEGDDEDTGEGSPEVEDSSA